MIFDSSSCGVKSYGFGEDEHAACDAVLSVIPGVAGFLSGVSARNEVLSCEPVPVVHDIASCEVVPAVYGIASCVAVPAVYDIVSCKGVPAVYGILSGVEPSTNDL